MKNHIGDSQLRHDLQLCLGFNSIVDNFWKSNVSINSIANCYIEAYALYVFHAVEMIYVSWMLVYTVKDHAATKLACMVMVTQLQLESMH